eukprot:COSAG02_NODE_11794_length_1653_cov_1.655084_1_plen_225_part_01
MTVPQLRRHIQKYCPQIAPVLRTGNATKAELLEDILKATEKTAGVKEAVAAATKEAAKDAVGGAKGSGGSDAVAGGMRSAVSIVAAIAAVGAGVFYYLNPADDSNTSTVSTEPAAPATGRAESDRGPITKPPVNSASPASASTSTNTGSESEYAAALAVLEQRDSSLPATGGADVAHAPASTAGDEYAAALAVLEKAIGGSRGDGAGSGLPRTEEYAQALQVLSM